MDEDGILALSVRTIIPLRVFKSVSTLSIIGKNGASTKIYLSSA